MAEKNSLVRFARKNLIAANVRATRIVAVEHVVARAKAG